MVLRFNRIRSKNEPDPQPRFQGMSSEVIEALSHVCDIFDSDGNRNGILRFFT
jgi:hypothetical protein